MAIQLKPDFAEAYKQRGSVYILDKKDAIPAIADFTKYIQFKPNDGEAYYFRGPSWLLLQNWEKAKADLADAQNSGFDIVDNFLSFYGNVEEFEEGFKVKLPEDIAAILTHY